MIKKLFASLVVVALLSFVAPAYAGVTGGAKQVFNKLLVNDTIKHFSTDITSESNGSGAFYIGDKTKVGFVVEIISAQSSPTSFQVEVEVNVAGVGAVDTPTNDKRWAIVDIINTNDGTDAPVIALDYPTDKQDNFMIAYLPMDFPAQYVSVEVVGTGTDTTNTYLIDMWVTWQSER